MMAKSDAQATGSERVRLLTRRDWEEIVGRLGRSVHSHIRVNYRNGRFPDGDWKTRADAARFLNDTVDTMAKAHKMSETAPEMPTYVEVEAESAA